MIMKADRIVVMTPNWLGDAVMALPAIGAVRRHRPSAVLIVAARASTAALFGMVAGVDEVVSLDAGGGWRGAARWSDDAKALAAARADLAILLPNSFRSAWTCWKAGIEERWGYRADLRSRLLTRAVAKLRGQVHQSVYYTNLTTELGIPLAEPARLAVPDSATARAAELLAASGVRGDATLVGMAPGAAYGRAKQWPPERFGALARLLHERLGVVSVVVGARADRPAGNAILPAPHVVDLIGRTDLAALVGVMARCRAFVSNDSGAMHLAAAVGLPVTAIFGSTNEKGTAPLPALSALNPPHEILTGDAWCRPCMLRECPIDHRCMTGIDAGRAYDAVARQLAARPESRTT